MDFSQDFNPHWTKNKITFNHDPSIPNNFRCIAVGDSGSGKTFRVFNMLLRPGFIDYDTLHIYSPTLYQDEYKMLIAGLKNKLHKEDIIACFQNQDILDNDPEVVAQNYAKTLKDEEKWNDVKIYTYGPPATGLIKLLPNPDDLEKGRKHLIVFDDCMTGAQEQIENYFIRGRHNNCNVIYISQNWFKLPNQTIRGNSNLVMLFPSIPQDRLKRLYNEVLATGLYSYCDQETGAVKSLNKDTFVNYCTEAWNQAYRYVTINKEKKIIY